MDEQIGERFNRLVNEARVLPQTREIAREDGSATFVTHNHVVINYGTKEQNHTRRECSCGCGHGCPILTPAESKAVDIVATVGLGSVIAFFGYRLAIAFKDTFHF